MSRRASFISKVAGIDLILSRLDQQDEVARRILAQATATNSRVSKLEEKDIRREVREEVVKSELGEKSINRREYWAAAIGAGCIGAITLLLHLGGVA